MKNDRVLGGLALAVGIVVFWATSDFPGADTNRPGPAFLPRVLAAFFAMCGFVLALRGGATDEGKPTIEGIGWAKGAILVAALFVYIAVIKEIGFVVASTALVAAVFLLVGNSILTSLIATLILVPVTYTLFSTVMGVVLPRGWLGW